MRKVIDKLKNWGKMNRYSDNVMIKTLIIMLYFTRKALSTLKCLFCDKGFRSIIYMRIFKAHRLQQTTPFTSMDRYPVIFNGCKDYFEGKKNIKILSYGCSTGEEVLTLRKYFPDATIIGADINKHSLKICRKLPIDDKMAFIYSHPKEIKKYGQFDLVLCMAVLQRTPHQVTEQGITNLKKIYPFEKFEQQIIELDQYVKTGGLLVTHFTQYDFIDTGVAIKYKALGNYNQDDYQSAIFDKNSQLIKEPTTRNSIFIKKCS